METTPFLVWEGTTRSAGRSGDDSLVGDEGNDVLYGGDGKDTSIGGAGDDYLQGNQGADLVRGNDGVDKILYDHEDQVYAGDGNDEITANFDWADAGLVDGGIVSGDAGDDYIRLDFKGTHRWFSGSISGGEGDDHIIVSADYYAGQVIDGGPGFDSFEWYYGSSLGYIRNFELIAIRGFQNAAVVFDDAIIPTGGHVQIYQECRGVIDGSAETDGAFHFVGSEWDMGSSEKESDHNDQFIGGAGDDLFDASSGDDTLQGNAGNDTINGQDGIDTAVYSGNYAEYSVETVPGGLQVTDINGGEEGVDFLRNINRIQFLDQTRDYVVAGQLLIGTEAPDTLEAGDGDDTIDGGSGIDTMKGCYGDDEYEVDNPGDIISEWAGYGVDDVITTSNYVLPANVENLHLSNGAHTGSGNDAANQIHGNADGNELSGLGGADSIDCGYGNDTVTGGSGDDTVDAGVGDDVIVGAADGGNHYTGGSGVDTIDYTSVSVTINIDLGLNSASGQSISDQLSQIENAIGGKAGDHLFGNSGANLLDGSAGADTLTGELGNDRYLVDHAADVIVETSTSATEIDTVEAEVTHTLEVNVEKLILAGSHAINGNGNGSPNTITGNAASNILDGKGGNDTLVGGGGNDVYMVDSTADKVIESGTAATEVDTVQASVTHTLEVNIEKLVLTGASSTNGYGNSAPNTITGNSAANILDGMSGADTLIGGTGNDVYMVDNAGDRISETSSVAAEIDTVQTSISRTLEVNVENLVLNGSNSTTGSGNSLANKITGNSAANTLDGKSGNDTLIGGSGRDIYVVDSAKDRIIESSTVATEIDLVQTTVSRTLEVNIENLAITGIGSANGYGNNLANALTGNSAANILDGKSGNDTLIGGAATMFTSLIVLPIKLWRPAPPPPKLIQSVPEFPTRLKSTSRTSF